MFIKHQFVQALKAFDNLIETAREIKRQGRSVERKMKPKRPYSMAYKRLWRERSVSLDSIRSEGTSLLNSMIRIGRMEWVLYLRKLNFIRRKGGV